MEMTSFMSACCELAIATTGSTAGQPSKHVKNQRGQLGL